jgi:pimeloyl-ACP methyl ester carboxylesterase
VTPDVRHRDVRVNGVRLHVAEAGAGPPLLLLHGWPQHWWCWRDMIPALAERHRVLAPDLRGWGRSDAPPGDYAKTTFAADVLALMDAEGIGAADVIGHDWGGWVGFLLALDHPERVRRLVALDIVPPWPGPLRPRHAVVPLLASYQVLIATPVLGEKAQTRGGLVRRMLHAGSAGKHWSDEEVETYAAPLREPARAAASSACYRTFLTREAWQARDPEALAVPSLLLMGERSALRRVIDPQPSRNLRVESVQGAGHFLPEEAPGQVLERALEHLAEPAP